MARRGLLAAVVAQVAVAGAVRLGEVSDQAEVELATDAPAPAEPEDEVKELSSQPMHRSTVHRVTSTDSLLLPRKPPESPLIPADRFFDFWPKSWRQVFKPERTLSDGPFSHVCSAVLRLPEDANVTGPYNVAIKTQAADSSKDTGLGSMFMHNEEQAMRILKGPPFITMYHTDQYWSRCGRALKRRVMITAMELAEGPSLESVLSAGGFEVDAMLKLFCELLYGLKAMYAHGIVHRDLEPANLLVVGDCLSSAGCHLRIIDFGSACCFASPSNSSVLPCDWHIGGTVTYSAPEFLTLSLLPESTWTSGTSDVWSAGLLLYRILCNGSLPPAFESAVVTGRPVFVKYLQDLEARLQEDRCFDAIRSSAHPGWATLLEEMLTVRSPQRIKPSAAFRRAVELAEERGLSFDLGPPPPPLPASIEPPRVASTELVAVRANAPRPQGRAATAAVCFLLASGLAAPL